jgi:iron uptake system EfeUOB component EfeO/EfeM
MGKTNTSMRKKYRIKKINQSKKNRKSLRRKTIRSKSTTQRSNSSSNNSNSTNKVKCCICEKKVDIHGTLIPGICLRRHGLKAHRICSKCWWDPKKGFAREDAPHHCPGCEKNMPFTFTNQKKDSKNSNKKPIVIDLTSDSDEE